MHASWSLNWDFGDGSRSALAEPTYTYPRGGDYTVTLTVRNSAGDSRVARSTLQVGAYNRVQGSDCSGLAFSGWCWQQPAAAACEWLDAQFVDANTGWAVGTMNSILSTRDGGVTWRKQHAPAPPVPLDSFSVHPGAGRLEQVKFFDSQVGVVSASFPGNVLRTEDGGNNWQTLVLPPMWWIRKVWLIDRQTILLTGFERSSRFGYGLNEADKTRISTDGGKTWRTSAIVVGEVSAGPTLWSWVSPFSSRFEVSRDLGLTSEPTTPCCLRSVVSLPRPVLLGDVDLLLRTEDSSDLAARAELLHRSANRGLSWQSVTIQAPVAGQRLLGVNYRSATDVWASFYSTTESQGVTVNVTPPRWQRARSTDGGARWQAVGSPVDGTGTHLAAHRLDRSGWAVVSDSRVAQSFDDGDTGNRTLTLPESGRLLRSVTRQGGTLLAGFGDTTADRWYTSTDAGAHWSIVPGGQTGEPPAAVTGLWFFGLNQGLAASADGSLLRTTDAGRSWSQVTASPSLPTASLQFTADAVGWGLIDQLLWRSNDRGQSWQRLNSPVGRPVHLQFLDAQRGWIVTQLCPVGGDLTACKYTLYGTVNGASSWLPVPAPDQIRLVHFTSDQHGIAVAAAQTWVTIDGGRHWTESVSPPLSIQPAKVRFIDSQTGWMLFSATAGPRGGTVGYVKRTRDGGKTWSDVGALPIANSYAVDLAFADALRGWVVGTGGLLLATQDGGDSWQTQTSGTDRDLNAVVAFDTVTAWVGGARGTVLTTSSGGR